jgi:hypothetical protein
MDYLRLLLLAGTATSFAIAMASRRKPPQEDGGWKSKMTAELVSGRSAAAAVMEGNGTESLIHDLCRGIPPGPPEGDDSAGLLLRAALLARSTSSARTEEVVVAVKKVLDSFDVSQRKLAELASSVAFRGFILGAVVCFLVPFMVQMMPLLGGLQGGTFALPATDPGLRYAGAGFAIISSHYLSGSTAEGRGRWWKRCAFLAILFVSYAIAESLPILTAI